MKINELKDMCKVCGQTPCNCTHAVSEAASPAQQAAIAIAMKKAGKKPKEQGVAEGSLNELSPGLLQRAAQGAKVKRDQAMDPKVHSALGGGYMNPLAKHYDTVAKKFGDKAVKAGQRDAVKKIASPAVMRKIGLQGVAEGLDNTDDILQDLTSAYRTCVKHRDSYTNFGNIQTVYELLRDPLMKGDIAGYEKMHGYVAGKYPDAFDALMDEVSGEQGVAEGIFGSKENSAVPLVNKIAQVARQLTPQNVNVGKQIIQSNADDILRMMSPQAKTGIEVIEQGVAEDRESCPECGGPMFPALILGEKQDACYYKVKSRYKVWPSAYASGALVQCRKKGAANWGNKSK